MENKTIGERVRDRRIDLNISQDELAKLTGYSGKTSISKIEKGVNGIPLDKLFQFASALRTSEEYLIGKVEDPDWVFHITKDSSQFTEEETELLLKYRCADSKQKELINYILQKVTE